MNASDSVLEWLVRVRDESLRSPQGGAAAESVVREKLLDGILEPELAVESLEDYIVDRIDLHTLAGLLPAAKRRVVLGTIVDGASSKALADELGTSEENVRQLRSRAVAMVAELRGI